MNSKLRTHGILLFLRGLWLLVGVCIGCEDFRSVQMLKVTHSHSYQRGVSHTHAGVLDFLRADDLETTQKRRDLESNEHSHWLPIPVAMPAELDKEQRLSLFPRRGKDLSLVRNAFSGPKRPPGQLLRPPRLA